jgi:pimeloyl-ACP methyl ester carboxylesterase
VVTAGGPGSSSAGLLPLARSIYVRDRDVVVVEQRGTRWSEPFLACPEVDQALLAGLGTADPAATETAREVAAARTCAARLRAEGNDLSAYTTAENAADLADVRAALGYEQWNLWGLSYSTRLALTVLRTTPTACAPSCSTRSHLPRRRSTTCGWLGCATPWRALRGLRCAERPAARRTPTWRARWSPRPRRLDADPLRVDAVSPATGEPVRLLLTGDDLVSIVFNALYDPSVARLVPLVVDRLGRWGRRGRRPGRRRRAAPAGAGTRSACTTRCSARSRHL